jgi:ribose 1,5-bisphosphokinase PhnN
MLILIEGPDGAGKTTLAKAIADKTPGTITMRKNACPQPPLVEYTADLSLYQPGKGESITGDRWHVSERVYSSLWRGGCTISPVHWGAIESFLYNLGAVIVLVSAEPEVLYQRLRARGEPADVGQLAEERLAFHRGMTWSHLPGRMYTTDDSMSPSAAANIIIDLARDEEKRAAADTGAAWA